MENTFQNPILSGFHADPSICRVGDDYYLVKFCIFSRTSNLSQQRLSSLGTNWKRDSSFRTN